MARIPNEWRLPAVVLAIVTGVVSAALYDRSPFRLKTSPSTENGTTAPTSVETVPTKSPCPTSAATDHRAVTEQAFVESEWSDGNRQVMHCSTSGGRHVYYGRTQSLNNADIYLDGLWDGTTLSARNVDTVYMMNSSTGVLTMKLPNGQKVYPLTRLR